MSQPTRDQVEEWSPAQVASYLSQNKMRECAITVQRMKIDGQWFLEMCKYAKFCGQNLSDNDLSKFSLIHRPQLQKLVQDIKKNDDSIFNRLKRFQTEQTANIIKTGRNTLDRIKNKGPPKVPARDYPGDDQEQWSGSEFDSDVYEDPLGDPDNSYEPPPCERVFTPAPSISYPVGEYLDSRRVRQTQTKPIKPLRPIKPSIPERPSPDRPIKNDEDYVDPEDGTDDDNYIDPSEKENHEKRCFPRRSGSPDVYEVPDKEDLPGNSRCSTKLQPPPLRVPPNPSPRTNIKKPIPCPEPEAQEDYEVCNDECVNERPEKTEASQPTPMPREWKHPKPPFFQKTSISAGSHEAAPTNAARDTPNPEASQPTKGFYRMNRMPLPRDYPCQKSKAAERGSLSQEDSETREQEEEAGVFKKPWYARTCDRKTAEDTLIRSAKDGSYLVRKSSGLDALQPYTLVVFYNSRVFNIPIRYIPDTKQYALGKQKSGEELFNRVSEIIENHQRNALILVDTQCHTKDSTRLRHALIP